MAFWLVFDGFEVAIITINRLTKALWHNETTSNAGAAKISITEAKRTFPFIWSGFKSDQLTAAARAGENVWLPQNHVRQYRWPNVNDTWALRKKLLSIRKEISTCFHHHLACSARFAIAINWKSFIELPKSGEKKSRKRFFAQSVLQFHQTLRVKLITGENIEKANFRASL